MKIIQILLISQLSLITQQSVKETKKSNIFEVWNQNKDFVTVEKYGIRKDRFLMTDEKKQQQIKDDQTNEDVYEGIIYGALGHQPLEFNETFDELEKKLNRIRLNVESVLIPPKILAASINVYISNAQFLEEKKQIRNQERRAQLLPVDILPKNQNPSRILSEMFKADKKPEIKEKTHRISEMYEISQKDLDSFMIK